MRIICLSRRMDEYLWAFYQQDTLTELSRQHEVFFYGPGFPNYNISDGWENVFAKCPMRNPELVLFAHTWLGDGRGQPVDQYPLLQPAKAGLPTVLILNKEYANLEEKLRYIKNNRIDLVLTHHHDVEKYREITGCEFHFWPFAVDLRRFPKHPVEKKYDLTFTGTLRNKIWPETQSDIRLRIQRRLFHKFLDASLALRSKYRKWNVFWSTQSRYDWINRINHNWHLETGAYFRLLAESRIIINCLSPVELVTTRYFESMASKALALCEESERYTGLFIEGEHCVTFKADLSDFDEKVQFYLDHPDAANAIIRRAYEHVRKFHTWERRIQELNGLIANLH